MAKKAKASKPRESGGTTARRGWAESVPRAVAGAKRGARARGMNKEDGARMAVEGAPVRLLSGGNPQIAKGDGPEVVRAYIEAMSGGGAGWKRDVGRRLDALIERIVPDVRKAVRWNSPFYGVGSKAGTERGKVGGMGWFLGVHCLTKYVKVAFFRGASLEPVPPVESKHKDVRYVHIFEGDWDDEGGKNGFNEKRLASWVRQASKLPGMDCF